MRAAWTYLHPKLQADGKLAPRETLIKPLWWETILVLHDEQLWFNTNPSIM